MSKYGIPDPRSSLGVRVSVIQPKFQNNFYITFNIKDEDETRRVNFSNNVVSCDIPKIEFSEIQTNTFWSHGYTYGRPRWSAINLVVRDDSRNESLKLLGKLIQRQRNTYFPTTEETDTGGFGRNHMFNMIINNVSGQFDYGVLDTWVLSGCFITHADFGNVSYENDSEIRTINVTIRFNHADQRVTDLIFSNNPILRRWKPYDTGFLVKQPPKEKEPNALQKAVAKVKEVTSNVTGKVKNLFSGGEPPAAPPAAP